MNTLVCEPDGLGEGLVEDDGDTEGDNDTDTLGVVLGDKDTLDDGDGVGLMLGEGERDGE